MQNGGVVSFLLAGVDQGAEHLLHQSSDRQRHVEFAGRLQDIAQVFLMQPDAEAGAEVAVEHHRGFSFHHRAAGQAAANGVEHPLRVNAGFLRQHQGLAQSFNVGGNDNLVRQFGDIAGADIAGEDYVAAHYVQHWLAVVKHGLVAAHHNRQSAGDGSRFAAADRGIQEGYAFVGAGGADFLRH